MILLLKPSFVGNFKMPCLITRGYLYIYILFLVIWGFQKWCVQYPEPSKAKHVVVPILK